MNVLTIILAFLGACWVETADQFDGYSVVQVTVPSRRHWEHVEEILASYMLTEEIDVWKHPDREGRAHILVPRDYYDVVVADLGEYGYFDHNVINDLGQLIKEEGEQLKKWTDRSIVGTYARYAEILNWFEDLKTANPGFVDTLDIGQTYEGRAHRMLTLSTGGAGKWAVYVEGGMHAREWIAPATVIYITDQLIQGYNSGSPEITQWLSQFDFYIIPSANPDGYEYCHTSVRLWRKNRRPINVNCTGVDLNRNWDFQWGGVGSSDDPCSNVYSGEAPDSEVEVQNIRDFLLAEANRVIMYMAYHSTGQKFFTRWDYTNDTFLPDHDELLDLAQRAVDAIVGVHGLNYRAGISPDLMYPFSGGSADWARGVANIQFSYLEELRDTGEHGFILPPEQIIPTGEENWAGFQVLMRELACRCELVAPPGPCPPCNESN